MPLKGRRRMFRKLKVWNNKRKYRKKILEGIKDIDAILAERRRCQDKYLLSEKQYRMELSRYYKGRYDALGWLLNGKG